MVGVALDVRVEWAEVGWRGRGGAWEEGHQTRPPEQGVAEGCGLGEREREDHRSPHSLY